MRLWHKDLIPYLPRQQLIAQWRECCAIAGSIAKKGTPNHLLVNKVLNYPHSHFEKYTADVMLEMLKHGYKLSKKANDNFNKNMREGYIYFNNDRKCVLFELWHNDRYLLQCLANLSEKYDCGGIPEEEWQKIKAAFPEQIKILYQE